MVYSNLSFTREVEMALAAARIQPIESDTVNSKPEPPGSLTPYQLLYCFLLPAMAIVFQALVWCWQSSIKEKHKCYYKEKSHI